MVCDMLIHRVNHWRISPVLHCNNKLYNGHNRIQYNTNNQQHTPVKKIRFYCYWLLIYCCCSSSCSLISFSSTAIVVMAHPSKYRAHLFPMQSSFINGHISVVITFSPSLFLFTQFNYYTFYHIVYCFT
ncbi:hypothetical protein ES703_102961 [subsurface metagenome]